MKGEVQLEPPGLQNHSDSEPLLDNQEESSASRPGSSSEIKDKDVEVGSVPFCRICLESDSEPDDELIAPSMCKGTQQFVHRSCLDHWRSVKEGFAFSDCTICKAQFHLRVEFFEDNSWHKIKFRLFVARDVFLVFLAVQTVIGVMGGFAYIWTKMGPSGTLSMIVGIGYCQNILCHFIIVLNCCYGWGILDCFPALMEACFAFVVIFVIIFAILGIAYGFLAGTLAIQRIWQRHYHILTKRELTKEYIVEDLHGSNYPPKLDPEHEGRLKMLKLL